MVRLLVWSLDKVKKIWNWLFPGKMWTFFQHWLGLLGSVAMLYSLQYARHEFGVGFSKDDPVKIHQAIMLAFWIVIPPIWFWAEFYFLYDGGATHLDEFKHGQDQSSKIWLALVTVILGMYFGKDLIRDSSPAPSDKQTVVVCPQTPPPVQPAPSKGAPSSSHRRKARH